MNTALTSILGKPMKSSFVNAGMNDSNKNPEADSFQTLFSQASLADHPEASSEFIKQEDRKKLKDLLESMKSMIANLKEGETTSEGQISELKQMVDQIMNKVSNTTLPLNVAPIENKLKNIFNHSGEVESPLNKEEIQELETNIQDVLGLIKGSTEKDKSFISIGTFSAISISSITTKESAKEVQLPDNIEQQIHNIWQQFQGIVQKLSENNQWQQMDAKTGQSVRDLLQKLTSITQTLSTQEKGEWKALITKVTQDGTSEQKQLFQKLMTTFQNRAELPKVYHQQTPVTSKEIAKLVKQTFSDEVNNEPKMQASKPGDMSQISSLPSAKVEQHVIQMNQSQESPSLQKQLHQKLEQLIQSSRMFTNAKGNTEMQIKLRPGNLGDLTVKFAQVNGEMAVKILATSQAAKDMLEGNIKQLRHMFSPQQVVIEKVEASSMQQQLQQELSSDEDKGHGEEGRKQEQQPESTDNTEEEELSFHELLMNEKV